MAREQHQILRRTAGDSTKEKVGNNLNLKYFKRTSCCVGGQRRRPGRAQQTKGSLGSAAVMDLDRNERSAAITLTTIGQQQQQQQLQQHPEQQQQHQVVFNNGNGHHRPGELYENGGGGGGIQIHLAGQNHPEATTAAWIMGSLDQIPRGMTMVPAATDSLYATNQAPPATGGLVYVNYYNGARVDEEEATGNKGGQQISSEWLLINQLITTTTMMAQ